MQQAIHSNNPFGLHAKGFLWELLNENKASNWVHLDFGTRDGSMLKLLKDTKVIQSGIGLDLAAETISLNQGKMPSGIEIKTIRKGEPLHFPDHSFDSVSMIGVIEHIHDQEGILRELHRVLKDNGLLVVAVPGKHLFSFLDMGNWKFVFPRIHRIFYELKYSKSQYYERYIECRNGLIGDVEVEKRWHQHFSHQELQALLGKAGFRVNKEDGYGFWNRVLLNARYFLPKFTHQFIDKFIEWDARKFHQTEIFVSALKNPS